MRKTLKNLGWLRTTTFFVLTMALLGTLILVDAAHSATPVWIGPAAGGDFQTATNWTTNPNPPLAGDLVIIGSVNGTVTYSASTPVLLHTFVNGTNLHTTLDVGAGRSHNTSGLFIDGSDAPNQDVSVISGTVNVGSLLFVGSGAAADDCDMIITGASTVVQSGSGTFVGVSGSNATLTVQNGAKHQSNGLVAVGQQGTSNALLTVTGTGSSINTTGNFQVGGNNDAIQPVMANNQAKVLLGGSVTASRLQIGVLATSTQNTVTVSGPGSMMNLTADGGEAWVGRDSINNTLIVENNGLVDGLNRFVVGQAATSSGNIASILSGGRINGTGFDVRRGAATITNGSLILKEFFNTNPMVLAFEGGKVVANTGATGTIAFNSGTIEAAGAEVNNGAAFTVGDGGANSATYRMAKRTLGANGTHSFANGLSLSSNAILSGSGNIVGNVSGASGAQVNVGLSPGLIRTDGAWNNTALQVGLEVGNLALLPAQPGQGYDLLDVTGAFTHGGGININVAGYAPGSGMVKDLKIVGWGSQVGSSASTAVSFVGGAALPFQFRSDGLYLTNVAFSFIPEPSTSLLFAMGLTACLSTRRRGSRDA